MITRWVHQRLGGYSLQVERWSNQMPDGDVAPRLLGAYWSEIWKRYLAKADRRDGLAGARGSGQLVRYEYKIEVKTMESIIDLLHRLIAPGEEVVCDQRCLHVEEGLSRERAKQFLDTLDAAAWDARQRYLKTMRDEYNYEQTVFSSWRDLCAPILPGSQFGLWVGGRAWADARKLGEIPSLGWL